MKRSILTYSLIYGLCGGVLIAALKFVEPFPIGLIITVISAAILRKRAKLEDRNEKIGEPLTSS